MADPKYYPQTPFPDWAEDDTYPAGTDPWSGGPNKIEPVGAVRDPGVQPDDQLGAQQYNWLNHRYGRLLSALAHSPLQTWQAFSTALETNKGPGAYYTNLTEDSRSDFVTPFYPALGNFLFRSAKPFIAAFSAAAEGRGSAYGFHWSDFAAHPDPGTVKDVYGTTGGRILLSLDADDRVWILDMFGTWTSKATGAAAADGGAPSTFVYHQAQDRLLVSIAGGLNGSVNRLAVSDDGGEVWTLVSILSADYTIQRFADDGAGVIVAVATENGDPTVLRFLRSTDNGDTWSLVNTITWAGTASLGGLAYSPVWGQFMFVSHETGKVYISADGASWIERSGLPDLGAIETTFDGPGDVSGAVRVLACVGSVFATITHLWLNDADGVVERVGGVLYSFDCGTSWHFVGLSHLTDADLKSLKGIVACGGQFLVNTAFGNVIFVSGTVWAPGADLTVA